MRVRNSMLLAVLAAVLGLSLPAKAETVVRYGISMADIPLTTGQPDRGAGAYQFTAYTIYDPLVAWDMDVSDKPGKLVPGLATEWKVDDKDKTKWRFTLRQGVKFHDGSDFNADAVIWNLDKYFKNDSPQFEITSSAMTRARAPLLASYRKIDDATVAITTTKPASYFPYMAVYILFTSPASFEKAGHDWAKVAILPAGGTGPFRISKVEPRQEVDLGR